MTDLSFNQQQWLTCLTSWLEANITSFRAGGGICSPSLYAKLIMAAWKTVKIFSFVNFTKKDAKLLLLNNSPSFSSSISWKNTDIRLVLIQICVHPYASTPNCARGKEISLHIYNRLCEEGKRDPYISTSNGRNIYQFKEKNQLGSYREQ